MKKPTRPEGMMYTDGDPHPLPTRIYEKLSYWELLLWRLGIKKIKVEDYR